MSQFIPPTAHSASERAKFDRLRRQMDGRPYAFLGHTVRAIAAEVHPLPKTNHPSFPIFSDDAIMENTESYTVRQSRVWPDAIINCHDRDDITELKPMIDAPTKNQGNQSFRNIVAATVKSRDIMPHHQVIGHRFRVDMYRSNHNGTQHVIDLKVHVQRPDSVPDRYDEPANNVTPQKRSIQQQRAIESPEEDCFVFPDINVLCSMLAIKQAVMKNNAQVPGEIYKLPPHQRYEIYYYTGFKGLRLFDDDTIVGCHLRDLDEVFMRIVPSPPNTLDTRCNNCLIRQFEDAEGGHGVVSNGESFWLSSRRSPNDLLEQPRPCLDTFIDRHIYFSAHAGIDDDNE